MDNNSIKLPESQIKTVFYQYSFKNAPLFWICIYNDTRKCTHCRNIRITFTRFVGDIRNNNREVFKNLSTVADMKKA